MAASALAKTMTDEERKKTEAARRIQPVRGVRGPTLSEARRMARQGGTRVQTKTVKAKPTKTGVTNKAEREETQAQKILRFFGFTHPGKKKK